MLNMLFNDIGEEGAAELTAALRGNTTVTSLDISHNGIGDGGALHVAELLKLNTTLQSINLGGNDIGEAGAKALDDALNSNETLRTLDLSENEDISDTACASIEEAVSLNEAMFQTGHLLADDEEE